MSPGGQKYRSWEPVWFRHMLNLFISLPVFLMSPNLCYFWTVIWIISSLFLSSALSSCSFFILPLSLLIFKLIFYFYKHNPFMFCLWSFQYPWSLLTNFYFCRVLLTVPHFLVGSATSCSFSLKLCIWEFFICGTSMAFSGDNLI